MTPNTALYNVIYTSKRKKIRLRINSIIYFTRNNTLKSKIITTLKHLKPYTTTTMRILCDNVMIGYHGYIFIWFCTNIMECF